MKVVIIGGTGLVGSKVIAKLYEDKKIKKIVSITRKKVEFPDTKYENIKLNNFETNEIENINVSGSIFICCLGTTIKKAGCKESFRKVDKEFVVSFARLAKKNNAEKVYIVSAKGANESSFIFYNQVKGEMEKEVREIDNSHTIFLHPSLLIGERQEKRTAEEFAIKTYQIIKNIIPNFLKEKLATEVEDIANYIKNDLDRKLVDRVEVITSFS